MLQRSQGLAVLPVKTLKQMEILKSGYEVVVNGEILFQSFSYAMCNSYIFRNGIQGVRPTTIAE